MTAILSPSAKVISPMFPEEAPEPPPNKEQPADEIITPADRTALSRMRLIFIALFLSVRSSVGCVDLY